jgi:hypothetical protein
VAWESSTWALLHAPCVCGGYGIIASPHVHPRAIRSCLAPRLIKLLFAASRDIVIGDGSKISF